MENNTYYSYSFKYEFPALKLDINKYSDREIYYTIRSMIDDATNSMHNIIETHMFRIRHLSLSKCDDLVHYCLNMTFVSSYPPLKESGVKVEISSRESFEKANFIHGEWIDNEVNEFIDIIVNNNSCISNTCATLATNEAV